MLGDDALNGHAPLRRVVRLGKKIHGADVPTVPTRFRGGPGGPAGKLVGARVRPTTGELWLRLRIGDIPWQSQVRTIPLNGTQSPTPTPDTLELRGGMQVRCHEGFVGRLSGILLDLSSGTCQSVVVRIRNSTNVLAEVEYNTDSLNALLRVAGQQVLVPPSWAVSTVHEESSVPFRGGENILLVDATPEQIAAGAVLRDDGELAGDVLAILNENPSLIPLAGSLHVGVADGEVTLSGRVPTPRHKATAEQDAWHVPGVVSVRNRLVVGE